MIGHVAPEAAQGGPLAIVQDGDEVVINTNTRQLDVLLTPEEIASRLAAWQAPPPRYADGVFGRYAALVSSAADGAILRTP